MNIIDMRTRKKWRSPKASQVTAQGDRSLREAESPCRLGEFRSIGKIAAPIIGRLVPR